MGGFAPYTGPVLKEKPETKKTLAPYTGEVLKEKPLTFDEAAKGGIRKLPGQIFSKIGETASDIYETVTKKSPLEVIPQKVSDVARTVTGAMAEIPGPAELIGDLVGSKIGEKGRKVREDVGKQTGTPLTNMAQYFGDKWGSWDAIKRHMHDDPLSMIMDIWTVGSLGQGALTGGTSILTAPTSLAKKAAKTVEPIPSHIIGHLSGQGGPDSLRQSVKAGFKNETKFIDAIEQTLPLQEAVDQAAKAIENWRISRNQQYRTGMNALKAQAAGDINLAKTLGVDPDYIDMNRILHAVDSAQEIGSFEGLRLPGPSDEIHKRVTNFVQEFARLPPETYHTIEGVDFLKKWLGVTERHINPMSPSGRADAYFVGQIKRAVSKEINEQFPTYAKVMEDYAKATDGLEEIERALSLGDKATYNAGISKLLQAMRHNANTNFGHRLKMVDTLEEHGATQLKSMLAGAQMSSMFPRGLSGRNPMLTGLGALFSGHPELLAAIPFEMPYVVGKGGYKLGQAGRVLRDAPSPEAIAQLLYGTGELSRATQQPQQPDKK